jgi:hypothetical protein
MEPHPAHCIMHLRVLINRGAILAIVKHGSEVVSIKEWRSQKCPLPSIQ